jgi:hypothetical protein
MPPSAFSWWIPALDATTLTHALELVFVQSASDAAQLTTTLPHFNEAQQELIQNKIFTWLKSTCLTEEDKPNLHACLANLIATHTPLTQHTTELAKYLIQPNTPYLDCNQEAQNLTTLAMALAKTPQIDQDSNAQLALTKTIEKLAASLETESLPKKAKAWLILKRQIEQTDLTEDKKKTLVQSIINHTNNETPDAGQTTLSMAQHIFKQIQDETYCGIETIQMVYDLLKQAKETTPEDSPNYQNLATESVKILMANTISHPQGGTLAICQFHNKNDLWTPWIMANADIALNMLKDNPSLKDTIVAALWDHPSTNILEKTLAPHTLNICHALVTHGLTPPDMEQIMTEAATIHADNQDYQALLASFTSPSPSP